MNLLAHVRQTAPVFRRSLLVVLGMAMLVTLISLPVPAQAETPGQPRLNATVTVTPGPKKKREPSARIHATLHASPNYMVAPGTVIAYTIRLENNDGGKASKVQVTFPYNSAFLRLTNAAFEDPHDWVSSITNEFVIIKTRNILKNEQRTATLYFRVLDTVPQGTIITMWGGAQWDDSDDAGVVRLSNGVPLIVGDHNEDQAFTWANVYPEHAPSGTTFGFFSDRFSPDEPMNAQVITPYGVEDFDLAQRADDHGRVWASYESKDRPAGVYRYILIGEYSGLQAAVQFTIDP